MARPVGAAYEQVGETAAWRLEARTHVRLRGYGGRVAALERTRRGYVEPGPPPTCPRGHALRGAGRVLVGTQQCRFCAGKGSGPHRTYTCRACDATVYDPVAGPNCTFVAFDGREIPKPE